MNKRRTVKIDPNLFVSIVGDGLIAHVDSFAGAAVPVLVLNVEDFPDIREAIRVSEFEPDGDVVCQWVSWKGYVGLRVDLLRPLPSSFVISFDIELQGLLVEMALAAGVLTIKSGNSRSNFKSTFNSRGLHIELPGRDQFPQWRSIFVSALMEQSRRAGVNSADARNGAERAYDAMASMASMRLLRAQDRTDPAQ